MPASLFNFHVKQKTNKMIRLTDIQDALLHLVGWEQPYVPSDYLSDLTESESGLKFQDAHPLCTLDNIKAIIPDNFKLQYPEWNINSLYAKGAKVQCGGVVWYATAANTGEKPPIEDWHGDYSEQYSGSWQPYNFLTDYLTKLTKNGIAQMVQNWLTMKKTSAETKSLLERRTFFDGAGRIAAAQNNSGKIVGFEIVPVRSMGVTMKIEKIGLQMTGGTGTVKMYLFHSSQPDPIKTFDLDFTKTNGGFQWFTLTDCYLPYIADGNNAGGAWYLCYNQNDLPEGMKGINVSKDWSREPCGTCNIGNLETWRQITKFMQISPFAVPALQTFAEYPELWDIERNIYTNTCNYGINCEVSVGCDLTDFIISQRNLFADALQHQVAYIALRTMAMNPDTRVNRNQSNVSRLDILYELDGNTDAKHPDGLGQKLKKIYNALEVDTNGLDRICLTCNNGGVKYRTV